MNSLLMPACKKTYVGWVERNDLQSRAVNPIERAATSIAGYLKYTHIFLCCLSISNPTVWASPAEDQQQIRAFYQQLFPQ